VIRVVAVRTIAGATLEDAERWLLPPVTGADVAAGAFTLGA
jgi:hypothetical protein